MKIKIIRAIICNSKGKRILKPDNKVIEKSELEAYRESLKEGKNASVSFTFEEVGAVSPKIRAKQNIV